MTSESLEVAGNHVPGYAKAIMILQSMVIFFFVFWSYEEYLNNQYFQSYVNNSLAGGTFGIIAISTIGIFSAVASGLFMKLRSTRHELEHVIVNTPPATSALASASSPTSSSGFEPHVEQHLINMIRKSTPSDTQTTTPMPVLRRENPSGQAR